MKTFIKIFIVLFVLILVGVTFYIPKFLHQKAYSALYSACPTCEFKMDKLDTSFTQSRLTLKDVHFKSPPGQGVIVEFNVKEVVANIELFSFIKDAFAIDRVTLQELEVSVTEDDGVPSHPSPRSKDHWLSGLPLFKVNGLSVLDSKFTYIFKSKGDKDGPIHVSKINGEVSALGTRPEISPERVNFKVDAVLENSGQVLITCDFDLFAVENRDELKIRILNQKLGELNPFFKVKDNIHIEADIAQLETSLVLQNGLLTGTVWAKYKNFKLKHEKTKDSGAFAVFAKNILTALAMNKASPQQGEKTASGAVSYQRKPTQGLIIFLIQGLLPGLEKIIGS